MYGEGYRYFLVTAEVRSPSINIIAEDEQKRAVDIRVETLQQLANVSAFKGKQSLAFGVVDDSIENCFRFKTVTKRKLD